MKARWKNMTTADRITNVLIIVLSVAVIALAALQLLGIWEDSINVYEPLVGVVLLLQAIGNAVCQFLGAGINGVVDVSQHFQFIHDLQGLSPAFGL